MKPVAALPWHAALLHAPFAIVADMARVVAALRAPVCTGNTSAAAAAARTKKLPFASVYALTAFPAASRKRTSTWATGVVPAST